MSETPQNYTLKDFSFLYNYRDHIASVTSIISQRYGISSNYLQLGIAGSIAEEYHDRFETVIEAYKQAFGDLFVTTTSHVDLLARRYRDTIPNSPLVIPETWN